MIGDFGMGNIKTCNELPDPCLVLEYEILKLMRQYPKAEIEFMLPRVSEVRGTVSPDGRSVPYGFSSSPFYSVMSVVGFKERVNVAIALKRNLSAIGNFVNISLLDEASTIIKGIKREEYVIRAVDNSRRQPVYG
jgi:hypothetical protein